MAQAEVVNITSRRRFLAGAALASTAVVVPLAVAATPVPLPSDPAPINPELLRMAVVLDDAMDDLYAKERAIRTARLAHKKWQKQNPDPKPIYDEATGDFQPGLGKARSALFEREQNVMRRLALAPKQVALNDAAAAYQVLAMQFSKIRAVNMQEVEFKAELALMKDDDHGVMSRSALYDLITVRRSLTT